MTPPVNLHASGVIVGGHGVLVMGPSGSGKTRLCLDLLDHCRLHGLFGALLSDDQLFIEARSGRLVATAPASIAGLVELRGFGPAPVRHVPRMVVDRIARLVPEREARRMPEPGTERLEGVALPRLDVAAGGGTAAARAVAGWLGLPPFAA